MCVYMCVYISLPLYIYTYVHIFRIRPLTTGRGSRDVGCLSSNPPPGLRTFACPSVCLTGAKYV